MRIPAPIIDFSKFIELDMEPAVFLFSFLKIVETLTIIFDYLISSLPKDQPSRMSIGHGIGSVWKGLNIIPGPEC